MGGEILLKTGGEILLKRWRIKDENLQYLNAKKR